MSKRNLLLISAAIMVVAGGIFVKSVYKEPVYVEKKSPFDQTELRQEIKDHADAVRNIEEEGRLLRKSRDLADQGQLDQAIDAAMEAVKLAGGDGVNAWVARRNLGRIYEAAGRYQLAMQELQWAESIQTRPDVLNKLAEDRVRLEGLIERKTTSPSPTE